MRSILFFIPHSVGGIPLFGTGIALGLLVAGLVAYLGWFTARKQPLSNAMATLPIWGIMALAIVFLVPNIEQTDQSGLPIGLPVRGYGVMVLVGLLSGVGVTCLRGSRLGIDSDTVIGLGFWMMLVGVLGARVFYVVQKWNELAGETFGQKLVDALKVTEGGLVIYGGVIGGLVGGWLYCRKHSLPILSTADLIAPGFLVGLAFGRIGCLLHGCCFGGVCEAPLPAITFPNGSVPYQAQVNDGSLLGFRLESGQVPSTVTSVVDNSPAAASHLQVGDRVENILSHGMVDQNETDPAATIPVVAEIKTDSGSVFVPPDKMPQWSLPVHPSQIYAAINAALLALLIWHLQPLPKRDGVAFVVAIGCYAVSRFVLEWVRSDEAGQLGTSFTISQWIAMASGLIAVLALVSLQRMPAKRAWSW